VIGFLPTLRGSTVPFLGGFIRALSIDLALLGPQLVSLSAAIDLPLLAPPYPTEVGDASLIAVLPSPPGFCPLLIVSMVFIRAPLPMIWPLPTAALPVILAPLPDAPMVWSRLIAVLTVLLTLLPDSPLVRPSLIKAFALDQGLLI
jgi:hypothetical protein